MNVWWTRARRHGRAPVLVVIAIAIAALLQGLGATESIDAWLRGAYYQTVRPGRSQQGVVLVAVDDATVQAWGSQSDPAARLGPLLERLLRANPRTIAVVGPPWLLGPEAFAAASRDHPLLGQARETGRLLVAIRPDFEPNEAGFVEHVRTPAESENSLYPVLVGALDRIPDSEQMYIHYLAPRSRLPVLSLHRVEAGDVPLGTFNGRVIIVGVTSPSLATPMPTPLGNMYPAEIATHAIAAAQDERTCEPLSGPLRWGLVFAGLSVVAFFLGRLSPWPTAAMLTVAAAAVVVVDAVAFGMGWFRFGAAPALVALAGLSAAHLFSEQLRNRRALALLSERVAGEVPTTVSDPEVQRRFWQDLVEMGHGYLEFEGAGLVAELPVGQWHLVPHAFFKLAPEELVERRRDIRRLPYRSTYLSLRPTIAEREVIAGATKRTLVVPLPHEGRLCGVWLVRVPEGTPINRTVMEAVESVGLQMGRAIGRFRERAVDAEALAESAGKPHEQVEMIQRGLRVLHEGKEWGTRVLDSLPISLLVADAWGTVAHINAPMRQRLARLFPDGVPNNDIRAVLCRVAGTTTDQSHEMIRSVVRDGDDVQFTGSSILSEDGGERVEFVLTRFRMLDESQDKDPNNWTEYLLLVARSDVERAWLGSRPSRPPAVH